MAGGKHECAADGCSVLVNAGILMCRPHWYSVSKPIRGEVWRTWRRVESILKGTGVGPETTAMVREYRGACDAARKAVALGAP